MKVKYPANPPYPWRVFSLYYFRYKFLQTLHTPGRYSSYSPICKCPANSTYPWEVLWTKKTLIPISYVALIFSPHPPMTPQWKPLPSISYFASSPFSHSLMISLCKPLTPISYRFLFNPNRDPVPLAMLGSNESHFCSSYYGNLCIFTALV